MTSRSDANRKYREDAIAAARLEIARRVGRFCTSLSSEEFERLLDKMVNIHWKYDVAPHIDPYEDPDHKSAIRRLLTGEH